MAKGYTRYEITIGGDAILLHNGQLADPLNPYTKALKNLTSTRKKTDATHIEIAKAEYMGSLYLDSKQRVILPSRVLEAHLVKAAKSSKEGKEAASGLFVDTDGLMKYEGGPLSPDELWDTGEHVLTVAVRVTQARVMRTRPLLKNWETTFQVSVLDDAVNEASLRKWLEDGGRVVGIGDYRPRYGRYEVRSFAKVGN